MKNSYKQTVHTKRPRRNGIVLIITLVILVVLATLGYTLTSRMRAYRNRQQYLINYQTARYACDSGLKYANATLQEIEVEFVERVNEPDFSDVFAMTPEQYQTLVDEWAAQIAADTNEDDYSDYEDLEQNTQSAVNNPDDPFGINSLADINDSNDPNSFGMFSNQADNDYNDISIRGPYGPKWPLVTEPMNFEIGDCEVKIEIEDENAKYPIGWVLLKDNPDRKIEREALASFQVFADWMGLENSQTQELISQSQAANEFKEFKLNLKKKKKTRVTRTRTRRRRGRVRASRRTVTTTEAPSAVHEADFARLFHSGLLDRQTLAKPTVESDLRTESPLKYISLWGVRKVNINSAPRHVLEAAFTFGGNAQEIADHIIRKRREQPYADIEQLRKELFMYADSIDKCEELITATSQYYTVRVTATRGAASISAVMAMKKNKDKVTRIAVLYE